MGDRSKIEWRPVPTHAGYHASRDGRIRGPSGRVLNPMRASSGHLYVLAPRPRRPRKLFVHRAVLLAWVGPCPDGMQCRHLNDIPDDNRVENLRWGTWEQNVDDKRRNGGMPCGERSSSAKLSEGQVLEIRCRIGSASLRQLGREYGVSHTAIRRAANGTKWSHVA